MVSFVRSVYRSLLVTFVSMHSSQITCIWLVNSERYSCFMSLVYERHTIAFFGSLPQPNYQMYSVVITNNNIYISYGTHIYPSRIYKYSCYQYNSLCIFICVCLVLSKTPIKLYSQKQLLLNNNNYNSICIFICVYFVLSKTPIQVYLRI